MPLPGCLPVADLNLFVALLPTFINGLSGGFLEHTDVGTASNCHLTSFSFSLQLISNDQFKEGFSVHMQFNTAWNRNECTVFYTQYSNLCTRVLPVSRRLEGNSCT